MTQMLSPSPSTVPGAVSGNRSVRRFCRGLTPLSARLEKWQIELLGDTDRLHDLVACHGSPTHVLATDPFERNGRRLEAVAAEAGVRLGVYFARKANKALSFVDSARRLGWGVDTAGDEELRQTLDRGLPPERILVTAAVKPRRLLERAVAHRVCVVLDNAEETLALARLASAEEPPAKPLPVAVRVSGFDHRGESLYSRFGFDVGSVEEDLRELWSRPEVAASLEMRGLHFHLHGYDPDHRVSALRRTIKLVDSLREQGHPIAFVDLGGGLPVRYLESETEWRTWWRSLDRALLGEREPVTYRGRGLGKMVVDSRVVGEVTSYPYYQELTADRWLERVLAADLGGETVAEALTGRDLELRCEPGRSLLDGCGLTAARVEWVKRHPQGHRIAALDMNRTQCRTGSVDFFVDPLLVPARERPAAPDPLPVTYLTGAYCIEDEMLCWRGLVFPNDLEPGDLVAWPNTAGYFMHFLESRSHQFPLAHNVVLDASTGGFARDPIDLVDRAE